MPKRFTIASPQKLLNWMSVAMARTPQAVDWFQRVTTSHCKKRVKAGPYNVVSQQEKEYRKKCRDTVIYRNNGGTDCACNTIRQY
jgi:hypothetical protein